MSTETLASANRIIVPDRAGQQIQQRRSWPVVAKTNGDKVIVGYLPANCRLNVQDCQVIADGATPAFTYSLCVDIDGNALISADAVTAATFKRTASTAYQAGETIGVSDVNRPVYLLLSAAPASAGGNVHVDLSYFAP